MMAGTLDPVRSFKARIASLINKMVPMVSQRKVIFQYLRKVGSQCRLGVQFKMSAATVQGYENCYEHEIITTILVAISDARFSDQKP